MTYGHGPGTWLADANATDFLTGADLATDATDTGDVVTVNWPGVVTFLLTTGTVTGVNSVTIEGCETSDFSTADVVTFGGFNLVAGDDDDVYEFTTKVTSKFARAKVVIGAGGDLSASTLTMVPVDYHRTRLNSTTDLL